QPLREVARAVAFRQRKRPPLSILHAEKRRARGRIIRRRAHVSCCPAPLHAAPVDLRLSFRADMVAPNCGHGFVRSLQQPDFSLSTGARSGNKWCDFPPETLSKALKSPFW